MSIMTFLKDMKTKYRYIALIVFITMAVSCRDPYNHDLDESKLNFAQNDLPAPTVLDDWLFENFTAPYNIEVKYRWDASEVDVNKVLVPPIPGKVQSIMSVVKDAWITPYVEEAGGTFLKTFCPKQFVLIGSPNFNPGGTITLGTAEGGRKIVLFVVNDFDDANRSKIKEQMHTVHHEFAHILHQNIVYPNEFKQITPGAYTADWSNIPISTAQSRGFITSYAMSAPDEDFVEMVATMLTEGQRGFDRIVCAIPSADAQALIRQKQQIVVNYFLDVYKIDFYALQQRTQDAIDQYAPKTLLADLGFNSGQNFNTIHVNPDALPPLPTGFQTLYDNAKAAVDAITEYDVKLEYLDLTFDGNNHLYLQFIISNPDGDLFSGLFLYNMSIDANNVVTFTYEDQNGNADIIASAVQPMLDYFQNNTFKFDWIPADTGGCVFDFGGIYPQTLSSDYNAFGTLTSY